LSFGKILVVYGVEVIQDLLFLDLWVQGFGHRIFLGLSLSLLLIWVLLVSLIWLLIIGISVLLVSPSSRKLWLIGLLLASPRLVWLRLLWLIGLLLASPRLTWLRLLRLTIRVGWLSLSRANWWLALDQLEQLLSHVRQAAELRIPHLQILEVKHVLLADVVYRLDDVHAQLKVEVDLGWGHRVV
jgi:hypothetical protein